MGRIHASGAQDPQIWDFQAEDINSDPRKQKWTIKSGTLCIDSDLPASRDMVTRDCSQAKETFIFALRTVPLRPDLIYRKLSSKIGGDCYNGITALFESC